MTEEAINALRALAKIDVDKLWPGDDDDTIIFAFNDAQITIGHVRDARAAIAAQTSC